MIWRRKEDAIRNSQSETPRPLPGEQAATTLKPTRPYGDVFEYDNTPLQDGERSTVTCYGVVSSWRPTSRKQSKRVEGRPQE